MTADASDETDGQPRALGTEPSGATTLEHVNSTPLGPVLPSDEIVNILERLDPAVVNSVQS